jgi:DNA-directed RNA polymerase subunit M/transcription elongation factor TFIIS
MLIITETTESARLACESCGAHTTTDESADSRRRLKCEVCGAWEAVRSPQAAEPPPSASLSA